ncbi:uncharacterized protein TRUGW13939_04343 [Talaromyces rugulosus]|uniref:Beta-galactosidase n=1 Tax=Talaromyces rugulosus TaxID=121627 RepID=A0A7H8QUT7_TALRU|nr:uncharacterized protein TRUGW13939_04343 [Talaromyces rugulosus]QKX57235.1 hypothetical protein TRUGW13939_04343 [Talaromyces rugulosus]
MIFSGEFHPFRLPVPGLWLDIFQKVKAAGFTGVSFYTNWGLLEGNPGQVVTDGVWSLEEFFASAKEAGIYLIARPGPYINAETSAGGIPGWVLRIKAQIRSMSEEYLNTTQKYVSTLGKIIADAQITKGGPVILMQPENEYTTWPGVTDFPSDTNKEYMAYVERQFRDAGIVVPFMDNDNEISGYFAPGTGPGEVDLYGIDSYPMRYDCANPYVWPTYRFSHDWQSTHQKQSPRTPFAIAEFQGGSGEGWGGVNQDKCAILVNEEAERVVYKNNYAFHAAIFNIYMIYGGTNWGNLGYQGGDTSYDYGAAITEDRQVWREKYSELKLQANFLKVSPAYLTAKSTASINGSYGVPDSISVTPVKGTDTNTNFYVVRHGDFTSLESTLYKLTVPTIIGNVTIPQIHGSLRLNGRDSKIHVTDYDIGGVALTYSSAEIFTWVKGPASSRVLVLYGSEGETHEAAFPLGLSKPILIEGPDIIVEQHTSMWILHWDVNSSRRVVHIGDLQVHLVWRNEAYNLWVLELPAENPIGNFTSMAKDRVLVGGGYLMRSAKIVGTKLDLIGDINATTTIEVISAPTVIKSISFNGLAYPISKTNLGSSTITVKYTSPGIKIPNISELEWKYVDSLPEIHSGFNDTLYTSLTRIESNNPRNLSTPTSLYAMDYGYHTGSFIYRGHFIANGHEKSAWLNISGGNGYGHSIWLNQTFLGSWVGEASIQNNVHNVKFSKELEQGKPYVLTVLIDHMGYDEEAPGTDAIKFPRGILNFDLSGHGQDDITWKMTGNFGGERYADLTRGPLNEGSMYAERQGYHLPSPPDEQWDLANPVKDGVEKAGVGFFTTSFDLNIPTGWDVPMSFVFNTSNKSSVDEYNTNNNYRCQLFVNGYQFGKYVNNLGPQTSFPVPEGILNYAGKNYIGLTLWALDQNGAKIDGFNIVPNNFILSGYQRPKPAPIPEWQQRQNAY